MASGYDGYWVVLSIYGAEISSDFFLTEENANKHIEKTASQGLYRTGDTITINEGWSEHSEE